MNVIIEQERIQSRVFFVKQDKKANKKIRNQKTIAALSSF
jgi:hypothetical protein